MELNIRPISDDDALRILRTPSARIHFSQLGEDCLLWHYFEGILGGFYVDVGCYDPVRYSNTYLLRKFRKWRGINIDADPRAIAKFREARPTDINLAIGVGAVVEERKFSVFDDGAVNTFHSTMAARQEAIGRPVKEVVPVMVRPLGDILDDHAPGNIPIDYLNIDCEGLDHEVLRSNDWNKYRPKIVTVEIFGVPLETPLSNPTIVLMKDCGYRMISYYHATLFFERISE